MSDDDYQPLSPVGIEQKLRNLVNQLAAAYKDLAEARDAEVHAKHAYESEHRAALLSPDRPRVERGGMTTAERDAWVAEQCVDKREAYDIAEVVRKAAEDHLRVVRDQASVVQTLARSVQQAYSMAGTGNGNG
jgi:hypothetical protein